MPFANHAPSDCYLARPDTVPRSLRFVRILFFHRRAATMERCLRELRCVPWMVAADAVRTSQLFAERLGLARNGDQTAPPLAAGEPGGAPPLSYDLVIAEHPLPHWRGSQEFLRQAAKNIPVIVVTDTLRRKAAASAHDGGADWIELDHIARLPALARHALDQRILRLERDRAEIDLRLSQACLRALMANPTYGIARCSPDGKLLEANRALATMLGYASSQELLADGYRAAGILRFDGKALAPIPTLPREQIGPVELEWKRKDGTALPVRCSGRKICREGGRLEDYEIIAEDLTAHRTLITQLRHRAAMDPTTGLANYRQLVDVLGHEIKRSKRTGRELALLLLDLDGLKRINDRHGHLCGNRALCRLANILTFCCRSIDTPARFGGDEFAIVAPETRPDEALRLAQRIRERCVAESEAPHLSVSVGIASYPAAGETIQTLLHAADRALYQMKNRGQPALLRMPAKNSLVSFGVLQDD